VLKVLKVLNFWGAGKSNTFKFAFTGAAVDPRPLPRTTLTPTATTPKGHPAPGTRPNALGGLATRRGPLAFVGRDADRDCQGPDYEASVQTISGESQAGGRYALASESGRVSGRSVSPS
jgi:hypothetical protein